MTAAELIAKRLEQQGRTNVWLYDNLGISKTALWKKFKNDTFTANELIKIGVMMDLDLNEFKSTSPAARD